MKYEKWPLQHWLIEFPERATHTTSYYSHVTNYGMTHTYIVQLEGHKNMWVFQYDL